MTRGPEDHTKHEAGPKAHEIRISETMLCRILRLMLFLGPLKMSYGRRC